MRIIYWHAKKPFSAIGHLYFNFAVKLQCNKCKLIGEDMRPTFFANYPLNNPFFQESQKVRNR